MKKFLQGTGNYIKNLFSASESKYSTIAFVILVLLGLSVYLGITTKDIPSNCKEALIWICSVLVGYNGLQMFSQNKDMNSVLKKITDATTPQTQETTTTTSTQDNGQAQG